MSSKGLSVLVYLMLAPVTLLGYSWVTRYNGSGNSTDQAAGIVLDASGNAYVTGFSAGTATGRDFLTIKYNSGGDTVWTRRFSSAGAADDGASAIAYDPLGSVVVAGFSAAGNGDFLTIKYNPVSGDTVWARRYNGPSSGRDSATALAVDDSGNVYVTGLARVGLHNEATTVKYSRAGVQQWVRRIRRAVGDTNSVAHAIKVDAGRNVYICGKGRQANGLDDYLVAKMNPAGETAWVRWYNGARDSADIALALAVDSSGSVYVTGTSWGATQFDYLTVKYSSAGALEWEARYDGPRNEFDEACAIAVDTASNVLVTGHSAGNNNASKDWATVKYSPAGQQLWARRYNGSSNGDDRAQALVLDGAGNAYVTGFSESGNDLDVYLAKYDPTGATLWSSRYNHTSNREDQAVALAVPAPGVVYLTGFSFGVSSGLDYLTMKYLEHDVGVLWVTPDEPMTPRPVVPEARIYNYGVFVETAAVYLRIYRSGALVYSDVQTAYGVAVNGQYDLTFRVFTGDTGVYVLRCSTGLGADMNPGNDTQSGWFEFRWTGLPYWAQKQNMPAGPSLKPVKDGGALCYGRDGTGGRSVFALKGNKTSEFMRCHVNNAPPNDTWRILDPMPNAPERARSVKKGAAMCYDSYDTAIYACKGNSTQEFWKFDVMADSWIQKADIPLGPANKKVKAGAALVYRRSTSMGNRVYALKGNRQSELWSYVIGTDSWESKQSVPAGLSGKGMGDGSSMVNFNNVLYALKGKYNEFYAYYPTSDSWFAKRSLPMYGRSDRQRKAKAGSALATDGDVIYCIKGGCVEFWAYYPDADTWVELDSMPRLPSMKPVKGGGALTSGGGYIYALKGNKTNEFWSYYPGEALMNRLLPPTARAGQASGGMKMGGRRLAIGPNPLVSGFATLSFTQPPGYSGAGPLVLSMYDAAGRCVGVWKTLVQNGSIELDVRHLVAGAYLVRVEADGFSGIQKLVVQR